jgi:hypothetical protein
MLLVTTILSIGTTAENVFAYMKNQASTGTNACGNEEAPTNIGCQNIEPQIQGDENSVALAGVQTFPSVVREVPTEPPTTEPPEETCEGCFDLLTETQKSSFEASLPATFGPTITTIEALCTFLEGADEAQRALAINRIDAILFNIGVERDVINDIRECLARVLPEAPIEICGDNIDNDGDGLVDECCD